MNHLSDEQLTLACYGDLEREPRRHLEQCAECASALADVKKALAALPEYPVPERGDSYGGEVWARLLPLLPPAASLKKPRRAWLHWWTFTPALAALVLIAFFAGMWTQHQRQRQLPAISAEARERVLLMAMSDHLDRSQVLLAELSHAPAEDSSFAEEQNRARDLISENRLLRDTARAAGDLSRAGLLDDLERVLLAIANSPSSLSVQDLALLQARIQGNDLLFKVRVMSANTRFQGQKL